MSFFARDTKLASKAPPPLLSPAANPDPSLRPLPIPASIDREPPCPGIFIAAHTYDRPEFLVDRKLRRSLRRHYAKLLAPKLRALRPPRAFFLIGCPGEGKTENILVITSRAGIDVLLIAGADLGGALEGTPATTLQQAFAWIAWHTATSGQLCIILIDDIDASIIPERPGVERTNNTEAAIGKLQAVCNSPDLYTTANGTPVPLVWTANSTLHMRPALLRPGRTTIYRHEPDWPTRLAILDHLFQPADERQRRQLHKLAWRYRHHPISWWNDHRSSLLDDALDACIETSEEVNAGALDHIADHLEKLDIDALSVVAGRADLNQGGDYSNTRS